MTICFDLKFKVIVAFYDNGKYDQTFNLKIKVYQCDRYFMLNEFKVSLYLEQF